jgi:hypothetical protein
MQQEGEGQGLAEKRPVPLGADLIIPLMALAFASYFFLSISDLVWEAKANGVIIGTALVLLVIIQLVRIGSAIAKGRGSWSFDELVEPRDANARRAGMVAVTIVFIVTVPWLGLTLGLFLCMMAGLWTMGVRKLRLMLIISGIVAASAYLLFIAAVDAEFPRGPIENAIHALGGPR